MSTVCIYCLESSQDREETGVFKLHCDCGVTIKLFDFVQLLGWLLVAGMSVAVFLMLCMKRCSSPLGYLQEDYWARYHANEKCLYERTADVHSRLLAAENIKSLFGFVALDKEEKEQLTGIESTRTIYNRDWNRVTGVYLYRERNGLPLYSRIHKWATYSREDNTDDMVKELDML